MIGFEEFVRARHSSLLRYAYVLCGDPHLAQDLVQQALARCYPRWSQLSAGRPEAYVRRAVTTAFIDETRRPSWRREIRTELPERADQRDRFRSVDTRDALLVAMDDLSPAQKAVLAMSYLEDLPDDEIAEALGLQRATVRSHRARGLTALRDVLTAQEVETP
ncbi:SigE family RNA polymerase sigma factor [Janibacter melonis]|uniref:SigE family RNA polymerase sigma factor n=1 Tax=Janibacter melonis TaxID=262209 RepID=UPI002042C8C0|nr:SigE family RNA polymerase sigma factor [Janibacter melonis]MCM3556846.1 SigE family RNA polymerase sigma factor [Janibacter melonis]